MAKSTCSHCLFVVFWILAHTCCNQLYAADASTTIATNKVSTNNGVAIAGVTSKGVASNTTVKDGAVLSTPSLQDRYHALASAPAWRKLIKLTQTGDNKFTSDILGNSFYLAAGSPP